MPSQTGFAAIAAIAAIRFPLLSKRTWGGYPKRPWPGARGRGPGRPPGPRGSGRGGGGATVRRASYIVKGRHKLAGGGLPPGLDRASRPGPSGYGGRVRGHGLGHKAKGPVAGWPRLHINRRTRSSVPRPSRPASRFKYPTAAFAAVGAPENPFHSPNLGTPCCETKVRALRSAT
jgi:hypothetical protein